MRLKSSLLMPTFLVAAGASGYCAPGIASLADALSIASVDGTYALRLGGRIHGDYNAWGGVIGAVPGEDHDQVFLRRARVELRGQAADWAFYGAYNLVDHGSYDQVHVSYRGFGELARVTLGQQKEGFGLDDSASANWITGIERAIPAMAFATGLHVGLKLHGGNDRLSYSIGVYRDDIDDSSPLDRAASGRLVVRPVHDDVWLLHLGIGLTHREGVPVDYSARLGIRGAEDGGGAGRVRVRLPGVHGTRNDRVVEFGLRRGALHAIGEYFSGEIDPDGRARGIDAQGGYLTIGYVLTGEQRQYRNAEGVFDAVRPRACSGAWETFVRFDTLDVRNHAPASVHGGRADSVTLGLNWYVTDALRVSADWLRVRTTQALGGFDDGDALLARLQFVF